jgi:hypothetical protein
MKTRSLKLSLMLSAVLILSGFQAFSQGKFELSGGIGWVEGINMKVKYGNVFQIGLSQGVHPRLPSYFWGSTSIQLFYHIGKESKYFNQPVWYFSGGLDCVYTTISGSSSSWWLPFVRFGRTFNFSKKFGISMDAGPADYRRHFSGFTIMPSGSIGLFIRL